MEIRYPSKLTDVAEKYLPKLDGDEALLIKDYLADRELLGDGDLDRSQENRLYESLKTYFQDPATDKRQWTNDPRVKREFDLFKADIQANFGSKNKSMVKLLVHMAIEDVVENLQNPETEVQDATAHVSKFESERRR